MNNSSTRIFYTDILYKYGVLFFILNNTMVCATLYLFRSAAQYNTIVYVSEMTVMCVRGRCHRRNTITTVNAILHLRNSTILSISQLL